MKIEIKTVSTVRGDKKDGSGHWFSQSAYAYTKDRNGVEKPYPEEFRIFVNEDKNQPGVGLFYPVGFYTLDPNAIGVKRGNLEITNLNLIPVAKSKEAAG